MNFEVIGGQIPNGIVRVSGAKNSTTRLMAAALLTQEQIYLDNFPTELVDVKVKAGFLKAIGASVAADSKRETIEICASNIRPEKLEHYNYPIRTTYLLAAGQLLRQGEARIPYPGGCKIGNRKYNLHVLVWEKMGCRVEELDDHIHISGNLVGAEIAFPFPTVGGTENALMKDEGVSLEACMQVLGHRSSRVNRDYYTGALMKQQRIAVDSLPSIE